MDSFGFNGDLRELTQGYAAAQYFFDHWQVLDGDPFDPSQKSYNIIMEERKRKGLRETLPPLDTFLDQP
jgi:elongation factor 2